MDDLDRKVWFHFLIASDCMKKCYGNPAEKKSFAMKSAKGAGNKRVEKIHKVDYGTRKILNNNCKSQKKNIFFSFIDGSLQ